MEEKIQLLHPGGKKAVKMNKVKYDVIKEVVLNLLISKGECDHREILQALTEHFAGDVIKFDGSVEWHMEWVKLDLEARKEIKRTGNKFPVKYSIA
jgi:hypothetical protein